MKKRTLEKAHNEALKYTTRKEFQNNSKGAYLYATRQGILNQICSHMITGYGFWTIPLAQEEALKYESRKDFERSSNGAYYFAYRNGYLDEICKHMVDKAKTDNDVVYIWKAIGLGQWNDKDIYKVGRTSARLGKSRVHIVAKEANIDADIVIILKVTCKASDLETKILRFGEKTNLSGFDGASEFRAFSEDELEEAIDMIMPYIEKDCSKNKKKHDKIQ